ncbi:MAG: sigma-70 family RNA polymerase sigma factor [Planctomycetes bacterium]|nr:sigma-70 family RNA polymerase sigma factor [Planctomycetota bacterium]MBU4398919.1 sigma-70 family RNA polymerase sigma factor [Planctomycetota bacterium]MCG2682271.1 sigma-70 family RNA polymerase sigma factor [Planctomycetales bacterium]
MDAAEELAMHWTKAQPFVAAYITSLLRDFHRAEDVLQQVAVILVRKFGEYDSQQPFLSWALGIARLETLKEQRREARDRHVFGTDLAEQLGAIYEQMSGQFKAYVPMLEGCLEELDHRARKVLDLRYVEDLKPAEMAEQLCMTPGTVRVLLHRTRTTLRDCIERRMKNLGDRP